MGGRQEAGQVRALGVVIPKSSYPFFSLRCGVYCRGFESGVGRTELCCWFAYFQCACYDEQYHAPH